MRIFELEIEPKSLQGGKWLKARIAKIAGRILINRVTSRDVDIVPVRFAINSKDKYEHCSAEISKTQKNKPPNFVLFY